MYGTRPGPPAGRACLPGPRQRRPRHVGAAGRGARRRRPTPPDGTEWWAPEVAHADGRYWMYYSRGVGDSGHQLRVASSVDPTGPFEDAGSSLTSDVPFAIDPSPFQDVDGRWWLFYATDLVDGDRPGTVLAVQRLRDDDRARGRPERHPPGLRRLAALPREPVHVRRAPRLAHPGGPLGARTTPVATGCSTRAGTGRPPGTGWPPRPRPRSRDRGTSWSRRGRSSRARAPASSGRGTAASCVTGPGRIHVFLHAWDETGERRRPHRLALDLDGERPRASP